MRLARDSRTILIRNNDHRQHSLTVHFKIFLHFTTHGMISVSLMSFIKFRTFPFLISLLRVVIRSYMSVKFN